MSEKEDTLAPMLQNTTSIIWKNKMTAKKFDGGNYKSLVK